MTDNELFEIVYVRGFDFQSFELSSNPVERNLTSYWTSCIWFHHYNVMILILKWLNST